MDRLLASDSNFDICLQFTDGRDLVVAKFFFWRPGTPKQKSLDGLYRSLLHDILKSRPELIPETLRELYDEARATPWQVQTTLLISEKDIRRAFARLIQSTDRADASHCFCFFIDGLDEYQETAQNDLKEMVQLLTSWTVAAPRHVKLCVSSREYNVFMNSFSAEKRLRVHELTRFDMQAYIRDKLNGITDEVAKHELVSAIVAKAEGIFQWVTLVVKQIREELENGADSVALIQLVDSLPDELDRLYQHVLQSLSKSDRRKVYQTFAILSLANQWELSVSLFAYSFLEDYGADPTFAEREDFVQRARARGDGGTVEYRVELGRKRVRGWCKGLVEPVSIGRAGWDEVMIIDYAHRSIPDSLENKTIKDEMEAFLAGFSPAEALCQLILTEIRLDSHHRKPRICSAEFLAAVMGPLVKMRHAHHLDHAPFTFLRVLDTFADPWCWKKIEMGSTDLAIWVQDHWSGFYPIAQMNKDPGPVRTSHPTRWGSAQSTSLPGVLYHCALLIPGHEYPKWRIENDPTATDSVAKVVLVAYTLLASSDLYVDDEKFSWSGLDALLDRGLLTSKTETRLVPGPFPLIAAQVSTDNSGVDTNLAGSELSFWRYFLIHEWCLHEIRKGRGPGSPDARKDITHRDNLRFSAVVERFLLRGLVGADSRFAVSYPSLEKRRVEFRFWCDLAGNRGTTTENLPGSVTCLVELSSKIGTLEPQTAVYEVAERQGKRTYMCSLRRWIEDSEALPNKEELLRLLEREECSLSDGRSPGVESEGSQLRTPWAAPEHIRVSYALTLTVGRYISLIPYFAVCPLTSQAADRSARRTPACFFHILPPTWCSGERPLAVWPILEVCVTCPLLWHTKGRRACSSAACFAERILRYETIRTTGSPDMDSLTTRALYRRVLGLH